MNHTPGAVLFFTACLYAAGQPSESHIPRDQSGAPQIGVSNENGNWILKGRKQTVVLNQTNLALTIQAGPAVWNMPPSRTPELLTKKDERLLPLRLAEARGITIVRYDTGYKTGLKITLGGWEALRSVKSDLSSVPLPVPFTLYLTLSLEGPDEDLVFDVTADEHFAQVRSLDWPPALASDSFEATVLSNSRGVFLPRDFPKPYHPIRSANPDGSIKTNDTSQTQSNVIEDWSMSWWGFQNRASAMMIIVETPDDAGYQFEHPAGGPTIIGPRWRAALDRLAYPRSARMCFFDRGDYNDMAKRYRRYAIDNGQFVSLREKIARKPVVQELLATPLMRAGILTNFKPDGNLAKKAAPDERYHLTTFDERAAFLRDVKSNGLERLTVVLTGWPRLGYDRQHPDVLPPAPTAGGWEGLARLADTCQTLGYLFSLHDQYRDYYVDAPSYDPQFAVHEEDDQSPSQAFPGTRFGDWKEGSIPFMDHWDGGKMAYLNGRFMLGHLVKNYQGLFDHGIHPQGNYLDVFGYVPPDQDFNPEHPTTRTDCLRERARCYIWSRHHLGFVGTEAGCDWTIPYVDVLSPLNQTKAIPVPLFNLVYHDAVLTPYRLDDLRGYLNGGLPQIPSRVPTPEELKQISRICALHRRLALIEMTHHEFFGEGFRRERTTFADGTSVTVNWDDKSVQIQPELN